MTEDELQKLSEEMLDLVAARLDGCEVREAMANIQCLIGCLFDVMKEHVGAHKALMLLGMVMQTAAQREGPGSGVHVELVAMPKNPAKH